MKQRIEADGKLESIRAEQSANGSHASEGLRFLGLNTVVHLLSDTTKLPTKLPTKLATKLATKLEDNCHLRKNPTHDPEGPEE